MVYLQSSLTVWHFWIFIIWTDPWSLSETINYQRNEQELNWDNTSLAKESLTSGINLVMTQSVLHRWTVLNIIWRSFIKMSHLIGCCSLFDSRGSSQSPLSPPTEASSGKLFSTLDSFCLDCALLCFKVIKLLSSEWWKSIELVKKKV